MSKRRKHKTEKAATKVRMKWLHDLVEREEAK